MTPNVLSPPLVFAALMVIASSARSEVRINELMAANDSTIADELGEYDDWFEIINTGQAPATLLGIYASDGIDDSLERAFPDTTLEAGAVLLVWADSDPEQGSLHTNFKLSGSGESVVLWDSFATVVDSVTFGAVGADTSYARMPDGDGPWMIDATASPGELNDPSDVDLPGAPDRLTGTLSIGVPAPNPFNPFTVVPIKLTSDASGLDVVVHDLAGRRIRSLHTGPAPAGTHVFSWDGSDTGGRTVPSGAYLVIARTTEAVATIRIVLAK